MDEEISDEELDEIIKKLDRALDSSLFATDEKTRAKVVAVILSRNLRATVRLVDLTRQFANSSERLEKLTWGLIGLTAVLIILEVISFISPG